MILWVDWGITEDYIEVRVVMVITYRMGIMHDRNIGNPVRLFPWYDEYLVDGDMDLWLPMLEDTNA